MLKKTSLTSTQTIGTKVIENIERDKNFQELVFK